MKFGKSLIRVVELSNPEWGQYWINYKYLKKKIGDIVEEQGGPKNVTPLTSEETTTSKQDDSVGPSSSNVTSSATTANLTNSSDANTSANSSRSVAPTACSSSVSDAQSLVKSAAEVEFFRLLRKELKKTADFFHRSEVEYGLRWERVWESYLMLREPGVVHDKNTWTRLLVACVRLYRDALFLENFAIMNYCGFSKILKKHDKLTGFSTREAFMRNVMNQQNFTHYPFVLELIRRSEQLFHDIQAMDSVMPLQDEERLFIAAIRDLNLQASRIQQVEKQGSVADGDVVTEPNDLASEAITTPTVPVVPTSTATIPITSTPNPNPNVVVDTTSVKAESSISPSTGNTSGDTLEMKPNPLETFSNPLEAFSNIIASATAAAATPTPNPLYPSLLTPQSLHQLQSMLQTPTLPSLNNSFSMAAPAGNPSMLNASNGMFPFNPSAMTMPIPMIPPVVPNFLPMISPSVLGAALAAMSGAPFSIADGTLPLARPDVGNSVSTGDLNDQLDAASSFACEMAQRLSNQSHLSIAALWTSDPSIAGSSAAGSMRNMDPAALNEEPNTKKARL